MRAALTKQIVAKLVPGATGLRVAGRDGKTAPLVWNGETDLLLWDSKQAGFGLRVTPAGVRSYVFQYRAPGRSRRITLGPAAGPDALTLDQARKEAAERRMRVLRGGDPAEEKRRLREAPTVRDLWERFEREHLPRLKPKTAALYRSIYTVHLGPAIGTRKVASVRWEDFQRLHSGMEARTMANRLLSLGSKLWAMAARWGYWQREIPNPAREHDKHRENRRGRALTPDQARALGGALAKEPAGSIAAAAFRLYLLSGMRPGEVLALRWQDVEGRIVRLPDAKTGPRTVTLGGAAARVLEGLPHIGPCCFPGRDLAGHLTDFAELWRRLRTAAELPEGIRAYDAGRHTYVTRALELGVPRDRVKLLVGHAGGVADITSRYEHRRPESLIADADKIAKALADALDGTAATSRSKATAAATARPRRVAGGARAAA